MRGADKPDLPVGGRPLVAWTAAAVAGADRLILVGPGRAALPHAVTVREDPPGGGPVPALRVGLARVTAPWVAVLAADLPFLRAAHVGRLLDRARRRFGAVLVDDGDRPQWLVGVWRTATLLDALDGYAGSSLRGLMEPLEPARVPAPAGEPPAWYDCDTPEDVAAASRMMGEHSA